MTTETLKQTKTNSSAAPRLVNTALQTAPGSVNQVITAGSACQQEPAHDIAVAVKQGSGLLSRSVRLIKDGAFQLGLSAPGRLWYRDSTHLNVKEKAILDAHLHGFL